MCVEVLTCDEPYIEQSQLLCKKVLFSQSLRPLRKAFADLKKVIRSTKFCRSDLDFFESPGLHHWPQKLKFWENIKTALRYYPLKHVYHKWMSYDVWFLRYKAQWTELFCHFDPSNNPKNQNFEKMKKRTAYIIILHLCTTNDDYMMYGSSDIKCNRHNFLSFWAMFCSFTPPTNWKFLKKWKYLEISLFYTCLTQMTIICMVSEKWNTTGVMSCHFGLFFAFYTLPLEILSF